MPRPQWLAFQILLSAYRRIGVIRYVYIQKVDRIQISKTISRPCTGMVNNDSVHWLPLHIQVGALFSQRDLLFLQSGLKKMPDRFIKLIKLLALRLKLLLGVG